MTFLVLVCAQNLCGHQGSCLQSSFTCVVKKFWIPSSFADLESCHRQLNLGAAAARQQNTSPQGRAGGPPFPDGIPDKPPNCRNELQTLWCWKQTHERQKILTRQFLFIKWVQACTYSSWADTRAQNGWQWLLLISLTQLYLPLTWDLSRSEVHNLSDWLKA
jgi:hypothetical protein